MYRIGFDPRMAVGVGLAPAARKAETRGVAAVRGIDVAPEGNHPCRHRAFGNLIRRMKAVCVSHGVKRNPVFLRPLRPDHHAVNLAHLVRNRPRAVVNAKLGRAQQSAALELVGGYPEQTPVIEAAGGGREQAARKVVLILNMHRASGGEIALVGEIRSLFPNDIGKQFRDQEVGVGVALAVAMGRHIERHAVERDCEVGAMIELEAAKLILIGLALAAMLRDHEAGNRGFQRLARPTKRHVVDLFAGSELFTGSLLRLVKLFFGALDLGFGRGDHDRGRRRGGRERRRGNMRDHWLLRFRRRPGPLGLADLNVRQSLLRQRGARGHRDQQRQRGNFSKTAADHRGSPGEYELRAHFSYLCRFFQP